MLICNLRKDLESTTTFSAVPYWHRLDSDDPVDIFSVRDALAGKRVCVFSHGFNVGDAGDAYARMKTHLSDVYDEFVGLYWPGATLKFGFWFANMRANKAGHLLASSLKTALNGTGSTSDIEGHSLGCRVALIAARTYGKFRNVILAAPAVNDEVFDVGEEFYDLCHDQVDLDEEPRILIAYSKQDDVLKNAYQWAMFSKALGLLGPTNQDRLPKNLRLIPLHHVIEAHGDYKRRAAFFSEWKARMLWH